MIRTSARQSQSGQAMTEFTLAAAFFLIPLFLLIPWLGKIIDIRHSSIQMARYEAWEYASWYADGGQQPDDFTRSQPVKSFTDTKREARQRFLSDTRLPLDDSDKNGWIAAQINPLWHDHTGDHLQAPMLTAASVATSTSSLAGEDDTPDYIGLYTVIAAVVDFIGQVIGAFADLIGAPGNFDPVNNEGLFTTSVTIPLVDLPDTTGNTLVVPQMQNLAMTARAALLTDGWNAGGINHSMTRAKGLVATSLLDNPVIGVGQDVIGVIAPEIRGCDPLIDILPIFQPLGPPNMPVAIPFGEDPDTGKDVGSLWWGYVDIDAVHPDRLSLDDEELDPVGSHACDNSTGVCQFEGDDLPARVPRILEPGVCYYG
ncbi:MAG: hypothetical protein VW985_06650 [Gammaproteobacteria bacterium]